MARSERTKTDYSFNHYFAAIATDGVDYIEGIHGAYYESGLRNKVEKDQEFILQEIERRNTYVVHKKLGTLIEGAKTGTNLSDFFLFAFEKV